MKSEAYLRLQLSTCLGTILIHFHPHHKFTPCLSKIHFDSTFSPIYSSPRQPLLFKLPTSIFTVNETIVFRAQDSKRQHLTRICYFSNEVCSQRRHPVQQRELLKIKFALKQAMKVQRRSVSIALIFL